MLLYHCKQTAAPAALGTLSVDSQIHQFHREKSHINDRQQREFSFSCHFYLQPAGKAPGTLISGALPVMSLLPVLQSAFLLILKKQSPNYIRVSGWGNSPATNKHPHFDYFPHFASEWPIRIFTISIPATLPGEPQNSSSRSQYHQTELTHHNVFKSQHGFCTVNYSCSHEAVSEQSPAQFHYSCKKFISNSE